jgi:signal transduction histidine kinase
LELIVNALLQQGQSSAPQLAPADLNLIVDDVVQLFRPHLEHQGITLETAQREQLPLVSVDADRMKQVIVNLLVNARDVLRDGGTIRIETAAAAQDGEVVLSVSDSGPGIPADRRDTLFRAPPASTKPQGLGLGLRLVGELVQAHGGRLAVAESDLGGALFRIFLPAGPAQ